MRSSVFGIGDPTKDAEHDTMQMQNRYNSAVRCFVGREGIAHAPSTDVVVTERRDEITTREKHWSKSRILDKGKGHKWEA